MTTSDTITSTVNETGGIINEGTFSRGSNTVQKDDHASTNSDSLQHINDLILSMSETTSKWLDACISAVDGSLPTVAAYINRTHDPHRTISADEASMLAHITERPRTYTRGLSLLDLALNYSHADIAEHISSAMCQYPATAPTMTTTALSNATNTNDTIANPSELMNQNVLEPIGRKIQPQHVASELAHAIMETALRSLSQSNHSNQPKCFYFAPEHAWDTFSLPKEIWTQSIAKQTLIFNQCMDADAQDQLLTDHDSILHITSMHPLPRLLPYWNGSSGDCLIDATCQCIFGVPLSAEHVLVLRHALATTMTQCESLLFPRFQHHRRRELANIQLTDEQWLQEWSELVSMAATPKQSLDAFHTFVLANMIRRPIVVVAVSVFRDYHGNALQNTSIQGVYLPLLWDNADCNKNPICIAYTRGHYTAMLSCCPHSSHGPEHQVYIPVCNHYGVTLPVYGLLDDEYDRREALLRSRLKIHDTIVPGVPVAIQTLSMLSGPIAELVQQWLCHFNHSSARN